MTGLARPLPAESMIDHRGTPAFTPAEGMAEFVEEVFLDPGSDLHIEEHEILAHASIGYLWAGREAKDRNRRIIGTAQLVRPPQKKWSSLRSYHQVRDWFGNIDFLITLDASYCLETATDAEFLALLDHELSHCRQDVDEFDCPRFNQETGRPYWRIVGHDVEQFVGVTQRWGAAAAGAEELVAAAAEGPRFGPVDIQRVVAGCGTRARAA